jgi:hypothetical protein
MQVSDLKVQKFIKPQIKTLLEETLGRKLRFNYSYDRGGEWNQIEVTKEEKYKVIEVWSKQNNNIKRGPDCCWSGDTGDLFFKDEEGEYVVSIINPTNRENRRFAFHYRKLENNL